MTALTAKLTYIGRRTNISGKIVHAYLSEEGGDEKWYADPILPGQAIGTIIQITSPEDEPTKYYVGGQHRPVAVGFLDEPDGPTYLAWQVADRAAYERKAQEDARKRAARNAAQMELHIAALADAASGLNTVNRAAFARYVEDRIRGL